MTKGILYSPPVNVKTVLVCYFIMDNAILNNSITSVNQVYTKQIDKFVHKLVLIQTWVIQ
jgi:hypothetical protein